MQIEAVRARIEELAVLSVSELQKPDDARDVFSAFKVLLNSGEARAAEKRLSLIHI